MNIIKIWELVKEIESADVIGVDDWLVTMDKIDVVSSIKEDPANVIMRITVDGDDGLTYTIKLTEQGLNDAVVSDNTVTLKDHEGNHTVIRKYRIVADPIVVKW
jgi:chemotaxis response regulator CheB